MDDLAWSEVRDVISGRWPRWNPTDQEMHDWKASIVGEPKQVVLDSLFYVAQNFSSDVPRIKWVLHEIRRLHGAAAAERADDRAKSKSAAWSDHVMACESERHEMVQAVLDADGDELRRARDLVAARYEWLAVDGADPRSWPSMYLAFVCFRLEELTGATT